MINKKILKLNKWVNDPVYSCLSRYSVKTVWVFAIVIHLFIYLFVGFLMDYLYSGVGYLSIRDLPEVINGISVWVFTMPTIWAYYRWFPVAIISFSKSIEDQKIIIVGLSEKLNKSLFSIWPQLFSIIVTTICYLCWLFIAIPTQNKSLGVINFWYYKPWTLVIFSVLVIAMAYAVFIFVARLFIAGFILTNFFSKNGTIINLYPHHPENCGGMGKLGNIAGAVFLMIVIIALCAIVFSLFPVLQPNGQPQWLNAIVIYSIYTVVLPLTFYLSLWELHKEMLRYKNSKLSLISSKLLRIKTEMLKKVEEGNYDQLDVMVAQEKTLEEVYQLVNLQTPVWPINFNTSRSFGVVASSPYLVGLISLGLDFYNKFKP